MWRCKKNFRPRIKGIHKIKTLQNQLESMNVILKELKSDKEQTSAQQSLQSLKKQMNSSIDKITNALQITENEINQCYNDLFAACDRDLKKLKSLLEQQKNKEEQDRLRKIQEEMLRAQKQKEAEEAQKRLEEEQRKQKLEIETRRKQEEEKHKLMEAEEAKNKALIDSKQKAEQEERKRQEQIAEQEKRDHDLAMRLAPELTNGEVEPIKNKGGSSTSSLASLSSAGGTANRKHDLSKWKYAELRDAINTSCDLELLEACREEFHRRLKVYHAWKSKNKKQGNNNGGVDSNSSNSLEMERAPQSIIAGLEDVHISTSRPGSTATPKKTGNNGAINEQRFFRIPFARPADQLREGADKKKGWWYSHFDGKWIARQMEIYDDKPAVLLLAGVDDMHMCELSLEETGLTMKQGAEILEKEFEDVWNKNGGVKYLSDHFGQISSKYVLQIMQRK
jgi:myosin-6